MASSSHFLILASFIIFLFSITNSALAARPYFHILKPQSMNTLSHSQGIPPLPKPQLPPLPPIFTSSPPHFAPLPAPPEALPPRASSAMPPSSHESTSSPPELSALPPTRARRKHSKHGSHHKRSSTPPDVVPSASPPSSKSLHESTPLAPAVTPASPSCSTQPENSVPPSSHRKTFAASNVPPSSNLPHHTIPPYFLPQLPPVSTFPDVTLPPSPPTQ